VSLFGDAPAFYQSCLLPSPSYWIVQVKVAFKLEFFSVDFVLITISRWTVTE
ncbi:uncharacterized protein METZ01_LOCUS82675, partial [marine metagenome]